MFKEFYFYRQIHELNGIGPLNYVTTIFSLKSYLQKRTNTIVVYTQFIYPEKLIKASKNMSLLM